MQSGASPEREGAFFIMESGINERKLTQHNLTVYKELVADFIAQKFGPFSFTLKINAGKITDRLSQEEGLPPVENVDVSKLPIETLTFLAKIENLVQKLEYGTLTITVYLRNGVPDTKTMVVISMKRRRYPLKHEELDEQI